MSNLASTAPAAMDALLALIQTAGGTSVAIIDSELLEYEPGTYIQLTGSAEHEFEINAIGYGDMLERYQLTGVVRVFLGGAAEAKAVRDASWAEFQTYVMTTIVNNKTLGINDASAQVLKCLPFTAASRTEVVGNGWQGIVEFALIVEARITA